MDDTHKAASHPVLRQKLPLTRPRIVAPGNVVRKTGQGGSSDTYNSYDGKRS